MDDRRLSPLQAKLLVIGMLMVCLCLIAFELGPVRYHEDVRRQTIASMRMEIRGLNDRLNEQAEIVRMMALTCEDLAEQQEALRRQITLNLK